MYFEGRIDNWEMGWMWQLRQRNKEWLPGFWLEQFSVIYWNNQNYSKYLHSNTMCSFKCFTYIDSFHPCNNIVIQYYYFFHFVDEKTKEKVRKMAKTGGRIGFGDIRQWGAVVSFWIGNRCESKLRIFWWHLLDKIHLCLLGVVPGTRFSTTPTFPYDLLNLGGP